jgi:outer membrane biosynthesis protein TonB
MKAIRRSEAAFAAEAQSRYDALAADHARRCKEIAAENERIAAEHEREVMAEHARVVEGILEAHRFETESIEIRRKNMTDFHEAAVAEHKRFVTEFTARHRAMVEAAKKEASFAQKMLVKLGLKSLPLVVPADPVLPDPPVAPELPEPPDEPKPSPKPKVTKPEPLPLPPEPAAPDPVPTYTAKEVRAQKKGDPWTMVDTPYGVARAMPGSFILTNDETGDAHVVPPEDLTLYYEQH